MLSRNEIKYLSSLQQIKHRRLNNSFLVEGTKIVEELCREKTKGVKNIYALSGWIENKKNIPFPYTQISAKELDRISSFSSPNQVVAEMEIPMQKLDSNIFDNQLCLMLDNISDPGNLGTIIRTADWFGIHHIICSKNSVDLYNPKTIQSTMGSFLRTNVYYEDLVPLLSNCNAPIFGTLLNGENLYSIEKKENGIIIIGNESKGISEEVEKHVSHRVTIPHFDNNSHVESLNASVAAAIVMAEFRRK